MRFWLITLMALTLSACNTTKDQDDDILTFVCAMQASTQSGTINLAKIFKGTLDQGWFEVPMKYCNRGAGQLLIKDNGDSIAFRSKFEDDTGTHNYYSKAVNQQQSENDWFYVKYKGPLSNNHTVIVEKDENQNAYKITDQGDDNGKVKTSATATPVMVSKAELVRNYPYLSSNTRVKTGTELNEIYQLYLNH